MRTLAVVALAAAAAAAQSPVSTIELHNAAYGYAAAVAQLHEPSEAQMQEISSVSAGRAAWDEASLGPILDANRDALWTFREAARRPYCLFPLDVSAGFGMLMPHLRLMRLLTRLNACDASRSLALARGPAAAEALAAGLRAAEHVGQQGPVIHGLVAAAMYQITADLLQRVLNDRVLDAGTLAELERALRAMPADAVDWQRSLAWERASSVAGFEEILRQPDPMEFLRGAAAPGPEEDEQEGEAKPEPTELERKLARAMFKAMSDEYLEHLDAQAQAIGRPWAEADGRLRELKDGLPKKGVLTQLVSVDMVSINDLRGRLAARRAGLIALAALPRAEAEQGGEVATLDGLDVPADPFTGGPLRFEVTAEGYEIWPEGRDADGSPLVYRLRRK